MTSATRSTRKRQTRLNFTPLPSSSPSASTYPAEIRDRVATVTFETSPSPFKRRKLADEDDRFTRNASSRSVKVNEAPPTPARSSQPHVLFSDEEVDSSALPGSPHPTPRDAPTREHIRRKSQRKLDFSFASIRSSSSPTHPQIKAMFSPRGTRSKVGLFGSGATPKQIAEDSETESGEKDDVVPLTRTRLQLRSTGGNFGNTDRKSGQQSAPTTRTTRSSKRATNKKVVYIDLSDEDEDVRIEKHPEESVDYSSALDIGEPETSGDEILISSSTKKIRSKPKGPHDKEKKDSFVVDDDEVESEDEAPVRRRTKHRKQAPMSEDESSEDLEIISKNRKSRSTMRERKEAMREEEDDNDEDDDEVPITPSRNRRRLVPAFSSPSKKSRREQEDLAEDLEFLQSPTKSLDTIRTKKDPRLEALERLKQRRSAAIHKEGPSSPIARRTGDTESDSEDDLGEDSEADDEDSDIQEIEEDEDPRIRHHRSKAVDMFQEDENDEDFIVSDEDDTLGAPVDMPLAFTNVATMKAKGLFKYAVQWFVQRKINPAFDHDAEIYDLAFKKLDDQVKGLVGSKFTSSVWRQDFTYALQARPEIIVNELSGGFKGLGCEACGRQSHPATFTIQFQGTPYHIETLDEVSEEDSDDEPARRGEQYDSKGRVIPSEDRIYNLGVFCKNNATTAHTLAHWRYHLNDWIVDYLENQGYCSAEKLVERERWSTKKRGKYANEVVEEMMKAGEIERLYRDFQAETDTAREAKQLWRGRK